MYPLISLGPLRVPTYVVTYGLAVLVFGVGIWWRARGGLPDLGVPPRSFQDVVDAVFYIVPALVAGGWLAGVLPKVVDSWRAGGGLGLPEGWWQVHSLWLGQLGGASLAGYLYCRWRRLPTGWAFDRAAPMVPLAQALGRVGCLMAGCCYGRVAEGWPALYLPDVAGVWAMRYPTRIVDILANLLIFGAILAFEREARHRAGGRPEWPFPGFLFLLYVLLLAVERFALDFWRADLPYLSGPFTWNHLYSALAFGLAVGLMVRNLRRALRVRERVP